MPRLTSSKSRRFRSTVPTLEALEDRVLLSAVTVTFKGGNLTIKGDAEDNTVGIEEDGEGGIVVRAYEGTTINGPDSTEFAINSPSINKNAKLLFNKGGDNTVFLGVNVNGNVVYKGGKQNDNFGLLGVTVGKKVNVKTSDGDDMFGVAESTVGALNVNTGNGDDTVGILATTVNGSTKINTGNDDDRIGADASLFKGAVNAKTGNGNDGVFVESTFEGKTSLNLGNGDDDLVAYGDYFGSLKINGGSGFDNVDGELDEFPPGFEGNSPVDGSIDVQNDFFDAFSIWLT